MFLKPCTSNRILVHRWVHFAISPQLTYLKEFLLLKVMAGLGILYINRSKLQYVAENLIVNNHCRIFKRLQACKCKRGCTLSIDSALTGVFP